ncbi:helix-turn-helix domain-containing protein, partial [Acutalibacter sp. 1XD8-33]
MLRKYRYLTFADRKQISAWYQLNDRAADIAERLGMSVKTIYLELKRGEETDESGAVILDRNQRPAYNPV